MADEDAGRSRGHDGDAGESHRRNGDAEQSRRREREEPPGPREPRLDRDQPLDPEDAFDREKGRHARAEERGDDESAPTALGFSLPPISLPEMSLPERIRLAFPVPEPPEKVSKPTRVRVSWVLVAVVLADALDALAVAWAGPAALVWARAAVGTLAAVTLVGLPGLVYAWELLAILGGFGAFSLAPTLTMLVLARVLWSQ